MTAKEKQFNLRLSDETLERWRRAAVADGCSLTLWIERACNAAAFVALEQSSLSHDEQITGIRVLVEEAIARLEALRCEGEETQ